MAVPRDQLRPSPRASLAIRVRAVSLATWSARQQRPIRIWEPPSMRHGSQAGARIQTRPISPSPAMPAARKGSTGIVAAAGTDAGVPMQRTLQSQ